MNHRDPQDAGRMQRLEDAAEWLQRLQDPEAGEAVLEEWLDWCQRDPRNQQAFEEMSAIWQSAGALHDELQRVDAEQGSEDSPDLARRFALAASLAGVGVAVAGGAWWMRRSGFAVRVAQEFSSPVGVNTSHTLADGSVLELGGRTRAAVSFSEGARRIALLDGELFVTVQKELLRPFSVQAGKLKVVATGTQFNVLQTRARTTVTVADGSVDALYEDAGSGTPRVRLDAGQQLVFAHASRRVMVRHADPEEVIAWRTGTLPFRDEPLPEVIAKLNRYSTHDIIIGDARVAELLFTGTALASNIEGWLRAIQDVLPVAVRTLRDGRHLIGFRPGGD